MINCKTSILLIVLVIAVLSCNVKTIKNGGSLQNLEPTEDGFVRALIEVPSGTLEKWELNKTTGKLKQDVVDGKPRVIDYLGYPGNYGMIKGTLLSKEKGGDGDPLDILVLGPPQQKGSTIQCKIIGVLFLKDRGEQDDKLIGIAENSTLYDVSDIGELDIKYEGISEIIELWFTNYKGKDVMVSKGFGDRKAALHILSLAQKEYEMTLLNREN